MTHPLLGELLVESALTSEWRRRRVPAIEKTVLLAAVADAEAEGWTIARRNRLSVRMRRAKPVDLALEDEVWSLFARLGFSELSGGRHFRIPIDDAALAAKQLDVVATDGETIFIVECKASEARRHRSLAKDLSETSGLRTAIERRLRQHYRERRRVGWLYATRNIDWSLPDLGRADEFGIVILRDTDIDYWTRLSEHLGAAGRHQLQAEVFRGQGIRGLSHEVPALRGRTTNKRTFYQFAIEPERLLKLAFVSHRAKLDADALGTYQRMLKKNRLREIREYVDAGGTFPTNIVVNFRTRRGLKFVPRGEQPDASVTLGTLQLPNTYKSAWVIDGQHRLYGFAGTAMASRAQLPVLAFENLSPTEEAQMFVDINSKQVKVPRGVLVELMGDLDWESPDPATALHGLYSKIVHRMQADVASPLYGRVVPEGGSQTSRQPLTVAGLFEALRKSDLVGAVRRDVLYPGHLYERDATSTLKSGSNVLARYLRLFAEPLPDHWDLGNADGGYLCTNGGVAALFILLKAILDHGTKTSGPHYVAEAGSLESHVRPFIAPVVEMFEHADMQLIRSFRQNLGATGPRNSALAMMEVIHEKHPAFLPTGLSEYIESRDRTGALQARNVVPELELAIHRLVMRTLRDRYGTEEEGWWLLGVPGPVRAEVAVKRENSTERGALEEYFDLLDYKRIASARWDVFKPLFALDPVGGKDKQLAWLDRLNSLRNRTAHPARRPITSEEYEFVESLLTHFTSVEDIEGPQ